MNQRIKELESLCWKELGEEEGYYPVFDTEQFAKLIVQECVTVCDSSNYQFGVIFSKMIKEHFGVK